MIVSVCWFPLQFQFEAVQLLRLRFRQIRLRQRILRLDWARRRRLSVMLYVGDQPAEQIGKLVDGPGGLGCLDAALPFLRVLAVIIDERAYRSQSAQPSRESRVIAVGRSEIQKSLL